MMQTMVVTMLDLPVRGGRESEDSVFCGCHELMRPLSAFNPAAMAAIIIDLKRRDVSF